MALSPMERRVKVPREYATVYHAIAPPRLGMTDTIGANAMRSEAGWATSSTEDGAISAEARTC